MIATFIIKRFKTFKKVKWLDSISIPTYFFLRLESTFENFVISVTISNDYLWPTLLIKYIFFKIQCNYSSRLLILFLMLKRWSKACDTFVKSENVFEFRPSFFESLLSF